MSLPADAFLLTYTAAQRAIKPKEFLTVSEWADKKRILSGEGSAEPGPWKTSRNPPLREIMDSLSENSPCNLVAFMKPSQFGGTEVGSNWVGYVMDHAKGPMAVVMPTERSLNDWVSQKFDPMSIDTPAVAEALAKRSNRSADNNSQRKKFVGGILYFKMAGSTAELKSTSLRYGLADEIDEWPLTTPQGKPFAMFKVRFTTFHDWKLYAPSSPTLKDASQIEELFEEGDQRHYHVPCPHCGELQVLKWGNLRWTKDVKNPKHISSVAYFCEHNGCVIEEHHKTEMFREQGYGGKARWIPAAPDNPYRSYHINALYSPVGLGWSWTHLAYDWISAQGDPEKLMVFANTRLGETWRDSTHDIQSNVLEARAEPYSLRTIPIGCLLMTAGVDVQDDRLEIQITGHGRDDKTWPIDYHVLWGNPADEKLWDALGKFLQDAKFTNHFGKSLRLEGTAIDTGGHHTHMVYNFVRTAAAKYGLVRVIACKGASTYGRVILGKPSLQDVNWQGKTLKKGVALYVIGADTAKHLLYNRINGDNDKDPSERKVHFSTELEPRYFDGIVSEAFNPRKNRWEQKKGKHNEELDTWVLSIAASHHPELHIHKWKKSDWDRREAMIEPAIIEPSEAPAPEVKPEDEVVKPRPRTRRRRGGFINKW